MGAPSVPVQCNSRALCHSWSEDWRHCNPRWHWTIASSSAITTACSTARLAAGGLLQTAHPAMFRTLDTPAHFRCVCRKRYWPWFSHTQQHRRACVRALTGNPYENERMMHRVRWVIFTHIPYVIGTLTTIKALAQCKSSLTHTHTHIRVVVLLRYEASTVAGLMFSCSLNAAEKQVFDLQKER